MIDLQKSKALIEIPLNRVGIKALQHPIQIQLQNRVQPTIATFDMSVSLPSDHRGTHLSRFIEILHEKEWILSELGLVELVEIIAARLETDCAQLDVKFPLFLEKKAPISRIPGLMNYQATLSAEHSQNQTRTKWMLEVPVTSLCPCSKEISEYGAHNQRSHVSVTYSALSPIAPEQVIQVVEQCASCDLFGILKRSDEKFVTEKAYDNPKFVEDIVREVANQLQDLPGMEYFTVESENFESIHNHSAYAVVKWQKD